MSFSALFYPKSIAVIGASRTPKSVGNDVVKNLVKQSYQGKIYPVNPSADELYGLEVFHAIEDIPETIDLAVFCIPAKYVPEALHQAIDGGAQAAIVISAGFKEVGNVELEQEIAQICHEGDVTLIGPNCLGVINPEITMNASFAGIMPEPGSIAFVSQSGALCSSVLDYAREFNLGFSKFMSIGNKATIDEVTLLEYFAQDPETSVIAMYVEQLQDAPRFIEVCKNVTTGDNPKPILILKSGRTDAGASAIASHTGSLAGGDAAYEALFAQSGVIRPNTIRELFEFLDVFNHNPLTKIENVTIVTNAGGPGVITTDEVIRCDLNLSKLESSTIEKLQSFLPVAANTHNPVDILGDAKADRYLETLEVLIEDKATDALMVLLTPQTMTEIPETAQALIAIKAQTNKPIVACFIGKQSVDASIKMLENAGVSTTSFPELGVRGLAAMSQFMKNSEASDSKKTWPTHDITEAEQKINPIFEAAKLENRSNLLEAEALKVFETYHLPTLKRLELASVDEGEQAKTHFTSTVALKIISPDILHKSDVGGVMLDVSPSELASAYEELMERVKRNVPTARLQGVLAVEMAPRNGLELIIGANRVPGLGSMIMVGLGGVYVEVFKDIQFAFTPFTPEYAEKILSKLRSWPLLSGVRGSVGYDVDAVVEVLGKVSDMMNSHPGISELDINPLLVLPKGLGAKVLDARILLE